jgi:hypothetical protein
MLEEDVDFLSHHGSKGMRWGNRQKTNENLRRWKKENAGFKVLQSRKFNEAKLTLIRELKTKTKTKKLVGVGKAYTQDLVITDDSTMNL